MRILLSIVYRILGLKRRTVSVRGFKVVYVEKGRGLPLILLHGLGANKDSFLPVISKLAKRYRVIVPDLPGFGDSDRPESESYLVADQIARLHQFVTEVGLEQFSLGGNSMGGLIAGAYAAAHSERVTSLWLLAPAGVKAAKPSPLMQDLEDGGQAKILACNVDEFREILKFTMYKPPYIPGFILNAMAADHAERYSHHDKIMRAMFADQGLDEILCETPISIPTLIVWGLEDRALDHSGADILHKLIKPSIIERIECVGHLPQMEVPKRAVRDYFSFRDKIDPA